VIFLLFEIDLFMMEKSFSKKGVMIIGCVQHCSCIKQFFFFLYLKKKLNMLDKSELLCNCCTVNISQFDFQSVCLWTDVCCSSTES
jgi:hypothetical protein